LDKLTPRNPKYAGVAAKLDTGLTVHKVKVISAAQYAQRREELFFRINKNQMFELYNEYEADEYEDIAEAETRNVGGPRIVTHDHSARSEYSKPYLILDLRDVEQYNAYHMLQARSFPVIMLRRDQMHPEVAMFRNREGRMIIIVCDDERIGRDAATVLVNRGVDNIYLLTGGINEFAAHFPSYIEGVIPEDVVPKTPVCKSKSNIHVHEVDLNSHFRQFS
jgi:centrosomal protein CEP41